MTWYCSRYDLDTCSWQIHILPPRLSYSPPPPLSASEIPFIAHHIKNMLYKPRGIHNQAWFTYYINYNAYVDQNIKCPLSFFEIRTRPLCLTRPHFQMATRGTLCPIYERFINALNSAVHDDRSLQGVCGLYICIGGRSCAYIAK